MRFGGDMRAWILPGNAQGIQADGLGMHLT